MKRFDVDYPDLDPPGPPVADPPEIPSPGVGPSAVVGQRHSPASVMGAEAGPAVLGEPLSVEDEGREQDVAEETRKKKEKKEKKKASEMGRGVETMFRTSYRMHVDLSGLADSKANILISINGLIISVILAGVAPRIRTDPWLFAPTAVVLATCLAAISCAILAARPRVNRREREERDPAVGDNLMFFGGFLALTPEEYEAAVQETIREPDRLYLGMTRDIYSLGLVLDRKFRLLRIAYTVFMVGLSLGVVAFLVVYLTIALNGTPATVPIVGAG